MGGLSHVSLKVASALSVKVTEIPTSVVASELWLRDDLEEVHALLLRFLGYGFRLAMSNVGWLVTWKFVILVPDPIGVSPSWSLRGGARVSSGLIARQIEELEESFAAGPALQLSQIKTHQIQRKGLMLLGFPRHALRLILDDASV